MKKYSTRIPPFNFTKPEIEQWVKNVLHSVSACYINLA